MRGDSLGATLANPADIDTLGAYAFRDYGRRTMILLTNKDPADPHDAALIFATAQSGTSTLSGFDPTHACNTVPANASTARR